VAPPAPTPWHFDAVEVGPSTPSMMMRQRPAGSYILGSSAAVAAYAGLNPQQHQSGISVNRPVRISKIGNAVLRTALYMSALPAMRYNSSGRCFGRSAQGSGAPQGKADCDRCHAQASGALLRRAEDRQGIRPGVVADLSFITLRFRPRQTPCPWDYSRELRLRRRRTPCSVPRVYSPQH
jgi:hypothetical protein